jgi:hypothetical protein
MAETQNTPFTPYVKSLNERDPIRRLVPTTAMDIGANAASMPGKKGEGPGSIQHVGSGVKKG